MQNETNQIKGSEMMDKKLISDDAIPKLYEQVQSALFDAKFWVNRTRIYKSIYPIELMALMLKHHHGNNPEKDVWDWNKAIRDAASAGKITPRNDGSLMPLLLMREGFDWVLTLPDADKFVKPLGWSVSAYLPHLFNECFPPAALLSALRPS